MPEHRDTRLLDVILRMRKRSERFIILVETILGMAEHELADLEEWLSNRETRPK